MPLPAHSSRVKPQGPYTDKCLSWSPVLSLPAAETKFKELAESSRRTYMIVDLHGTDSKEKKLQKCSYPFLSQQQ